MVSMSEPTIPSRLKTMTPYLCCTDARSAIAWYAEAFDAVLQGEIFPMDDSGDGRVGHAEMVIGDSRFMLSDEWPEGDVFSPTTRGGSTTAFVLNVADVDAVYNRAIALGAAVERQHSVLPSNGLSWTSTTDRVPVGCPTRLVTAGVFQRRPEPETPMPARRWRLRARPLRRKKSLKRSATT